MKLDDEWIAHSGIYQDKGEKYLLTTDLINKYGDLFDGEAFTLVPVDRGYTMIVHKDKNIGGIRYCYIEDKELVDDKFVIMKDSTILGYFYSKEILSSNMYKMIKKITDIKYNISLPKCWTRSDGEVFYLYRRYNVNRSKFIDFPDVRSLTLYLTSCLQ
jgi:hypothetical protein